MKSTEENIREKLLEMKDDTYWEFSCKLIPNIEPEIIIGVRSPQVRTLAKSLKGTAEALEFLDCLPHYYHEENNLHALLIGQLKDYEEVLRRCNEFLPYVSNWATCDVFKPDIFKKHTDELIDNIYAWLRSGETYTIRFGVNMLMGFYLDSGFDTVQIEKTAEVVSDEYYVKMGIAWYVATALAKQWDKTIPFIENEIFEKWTHNKIIQKAIESYRISSEQKDYLRTLKIK